MADSSSRERNSAVRSLRTMAATAWRKEERGCWMSIMISRQRLFVKCEQIVIAQGCARGRSRDHAAREDVETRGKVFGAGQVVGGHHHGASLRGDGAQDLVQHGGGVLVESGVGFVEEDHVRVVEHGAADGEALLHAARKSADEVAAAVLQPDHLQHFGDAGCGIGMPYMRA